MASIPATCRAALLVGHNQPMEVAEVTVPQELEPGALLVRTSAATICASDVHLWEGESGSSADRFPRILGHEMAGRVAAIGAGADHDSLGEPLREGDRIIWTHGFCGQCINCVVEHEPTLCLNRRGYMQGLASEYPHLTGGFARVLLRVPELGPPQGARYCPRRARLRRRLRAAHHGPRLRPARAARRPAQRRDPGRRTARAVLDRARVPQRAFAHHRDRRARGAPRGRAALGGDPYARHRRGAGRHRARRSAAGVDGWARAGRRDRGLRRVLGLPGGLRAGAPRRPLPGRRAAPRSRGLDQALADRAQTRAHHRLDLSQPWSTTTARCSSSPTTGSASAGWT